MNDLCFSINKSCYIIMAECQEIFFLKFEGWCSKGDLGVISIYLSTLSIKRKLTRPHLLTYARLLLKMSPCCAHFGVLYVSGIPLDWVSWWVFGLHIPVSLCWHFTLSLNKNFSSTLIFQPIHSCIWGNFVASFSFVLSYVWFVI